MRFEKLCPVAVVVEGYDEDPREAADQALERWPADVVLVREGATVRLYRHTKGRNRPTPETGTSVHRAPETEPAPPPPEAPSSPTTPAAGCAGEVDAKVEAEQLLGWLYRNSEDVADWKERWADFAHLAGRLLQHMPVRWFR